MEFEYTIGDITTNVPWLRPTKESLLEWYKEYRNIKGVDNYTLHLGGGLLNNKKTWDVDLILLAKKQEPDYKEITHILEESIKKGFELRLLIDIFYKTALCTGKKSVEEHTKYRTWNKVTKLRRGKTTSKTYNKSELVYEGLYKVISVPNWTYEKIKDGDYSMYSLPIDEYFLI